MRRRGVGRRSRPARRRRFRAACPGAALLAVALVFGLGACAPVPVRSPLGPLPGVVDEPPRVSAHSLGPAFATPAQREAVVARVWQLLGERFYDPHLNGVDWPPLLAKYRARAVAATSDRRFYTVLKDLAAELRDSHTVVLTPRETVEARRYASSRLGLVLAVAEGQVVVAAVEPAAPAQRAGLVVGDALVAIDGRALPLDSADPAGDPAADRDPDIPTLAFAGRLPADPADAQRVLALRGVARLLRRPPDAEPAPVFLTVRNADDAVRQISVTPETADRLPQVALSWLDGGVAWLQFDRFQPQAVAPLREALAALPGARAVILDLRGNTGGSFEIYRWFAGQFLPDDRTVLRLLERAAVGSADQRVVEMRLGPGAPGPLSSDLPLAVLVDGRTASAAELTAVTLMEQRGALLVGQPTCGCAVGVRSEYILPDGGGLRLAETGFESLRGARMENAPTTPAVRVVATLQDLRAGRDPVLQEAQRRLLLRLARPAGQR